MENVQSNLASHRSYFATYIQHRAPSAGRYSGANSTSTLPFASLARRWVVERTHGWLNRFRRILVRWDKSPENYIAFLHFACALIAFRAAGLLG